MLQIQGAADRPVHHAGNDASGSGWVKNRIEKGDEHRAVYQGLT